MKRIVWGFSGWGWEWEKYYYDAPFTQIRFAWFYVAWNWDGLPMIFQKRLPSSNG